jgi:uncharacterized repeat protein (TIGR02543 family)
MRLLRLPFFPRLFRSALCVLILGATALAGRPQLNEAPPVPTPEETAAASKHKSPVIAFSTATGGFSLNTSSRETSRIFYRTVYASSENVPIGWTGNVANGTEGTTTADFKDAVLRRVNYFRAMAGVSGNIAFDSTFSAKCQKAALMMSANNNLSHAPPNTWTFYSADGAEAAGKSDLFLGYSGPAAITGYIEDFGSPNAAVGHRRWIFYPQTKTMGSGDIPDNDFEAANALWVVTSDFGTARPTVRDEFVAWPPPGYVPYQLVFPRWSFSYPGANFDNATVTMKKGTASVAVEVESRGAGAGENAIVWAWTGLDEDKPMPVPTAPTSDTEVKVEVKGVMINNVARNFSYTVTLFDARKSGTDTEWAMVEGNPMASPGAASTYTCDAVTNASAYQFRSAKLSPLTATEGAENGIDNVTVEAAAGYPIVSSAYHAGGVNSFHFSTPAFGRQSIILKRTALLAANSQLTFKSRFAYATDEQVARVFVSPDDGVSWDSLFIAKGTNSAASSFTAQTVSLAAYANRTLLVRFSFGYEDNGNGSAYTDIADNIGWYLDDIAFTNAQELTDITMGSVSANRSYQFNPPAAGNYTVQARGQFFGNHLFEWGPALAVTAATDDPEVTAPPTSRSVAAGSGTQFSVTATGPGTLSYQWFHDNQSIPDANAATFSIADVEPSDAGNYRVDVTNSYGTTSSNVATLTVIIPKPVVTTNDGTAETETWVRLNGHVDVHGQTVSCGFQYGPTSALGFSTSAGSASSPTDIAASIDSSARVFYRAYVEVTGGARTYGATKTVMPLAAIASLNVSANVAGGGTISGIPAGTVRVGSPITLTAQPASGYAFTGWTGGIAKATPTISFVMPASMTLAANFSSSPIIKAAGRFRGLALSNPVSHAACGLVTVTVGAKGAFSGAATVGGVRYPFMGVFDANGIAHFGTSTEAKFLRKGLEPLLLRLNLPMGNITPGTILGDLRDSTFTASIDAPRAVFTSAKAPLAPLRNPPASWVAAYTADLKLNTSTPVDTMDGRGWTTVTVGKDGSVKFSGALADNTRWSSTQPMAEDGSVPIFASLYGGKGSLFGAVQFAGTPIALTSTVSWFRPANLPGTRFAAGWPGGVKLTLNGGVWTPYKLKVSWPLPDLEETAGAARLDISGDGLSAGLGWNATFSLVTGKAVVTPASSGATATFTSTAATGAFTGSYKATPTTTAVPFSGIMSTGASEARGFFLTPEGSGNVLLQPQ